VIVRRIFCHLGSAVKDLTLRCFRGGELALFLIQINSGSNLILHEIHLRRRALGQSILPLYGGKPLSVPRCSLRIVGIQRIAAALPSECESWSKILAESVLDMKFGGVQSNMHLNGVSVDQEPEFPTPAHGLPCRPLV
jgi:hypothetical protein